MHVRAHSPHSPAPIPGILFFEDFGAGQAPARPEPPPQLPPLLTPADLDAARAQARAEGYRLGLSEARTERAEAARRALEAIAAALRDAAEITRCAAEENAGSVTRLLLVSLGAVLPRLCARFGVEEAAAVARQIQHALNREPALRVRVNPHTRVAMAEALNVLEPELREKLRFVESDAVAEGDVRIEWENGAAVRDGAALWRAVTDVLAPAGLIDAPAEQALLRG